MVVIHVTQLLTTRISSHIAPQIKFYDEGHQCVIVLHFIKINAQH